MKKSIFAVSLLLVSGGAFAGAKFSNPVYFSGNSFQGSFGSIRNSADTIQYLYCQRRSTSASCWARNASGQYRVCNTSSPAHLDLLDSLGNSSHLYVNYDTSGTCTTLFHAIGSVYEPMK
jgi:hypothetical protein